MIDYEQIEAEAAELARQFWEEIEAGLVQQCGSLSAATNPARWQDTSDVIMHSRTLDTLISQSSNQI